MSWFVGSASGFLHRRRRPLAVLAGLAGGAYVVAAYARAKLEEMHQSVNRSKADRDNLRRRFEQNQEVCELTVLGLLSEVLPRILEAMNVEAVSAHLSRMHKEKGKAVEPPSAEKTDPANRAEGVDDAAAAAAAANGVDAAADHGPPNGRAQGGDAGDPPAPRTPGYLQLDPTAPPFVPSGVDPATVLQVAAPSAGPRAEALDAPLGPAAQAPTGVAESSVPPADHALNRQAPIPPLPPANGVNGLLAPRESPPAPSIAVKKPANGFEALDIPPPAAADPADPAPPDEPESKWKRRSLEGLSKAEVWHELKVLAFTRLLTSVYTVALVALQTHIQLNLLGRYAYVDSVLAMADGHGAMGGLGAKGEVRTIDMRTERRYLTLSYWLLHRGWEDVAERIEEKVQEVVGPLGLKEMVGYADLGRILGAVQSKVQDEDDASDFSFASTLFPPTTVAELETLRSGGMLPPDCVIDPPLRGLLDETADFADSPDFSRVLDAAVSRALASVLERVAAAADIRRAEPAPVHHPQPKMREVTEGDDGAGWADERRVRLADVLPAVTREAHAVLNGAPNECAEVIAETRELLAFSSVIYTSFDACQRA